MVFEEEAFRHTVKDTKRSKLVVETGNSAPAKAPRQKTACVSSSEDNQ